MTRLTIIVLLGALAWMIWWATGQIAYEKALTAWVEDRRDDGWAADIATLETVGFPSRFDTTVTGINLADPETGIAWSAPEVQFLSLAYKPHEVIAVVPGPHRFSTPYETLEIAHEDARASLFLGPSASLPLESARLVVKKLDLASTLGWTATLAEGRLAAERVAVTDNAYRIGAELLGLVPAEPVRAMLDPAGLLPETVETLHLDARVAFDAPWDRTAIEQRRPQPRRIELTDFSARWGEVLFRAAGEVRIDEQGFPEGSVTVRAEEWRKLLDMAVASGLLPEALRPSVETGLGLLSGGTDKIDAPLEFADGQVRLGLLPLGPAPRLVLR
jgi:hypothetical protein